uniref:T-box-containing protein TBX6L-like n=1 Tax=Stegastes partitus TaxID=144197 RepID=A0A3B4Z048_9TELE
MEMKCFSLGHLDYFKFFLSTRLLTIPLHPNCKLAPAPPALGSRTASSSCSLEEHDETSYILQTQLFCVLSTESRLNLSMPRSPAAAHSYQQGAIRMTLENADLWKSFHSIGTEMIITKHGRRMFPHCNVSVTGLQPYTSYVLMMDMVPVDGFKYKWEVAGKAEPQPPCRTFTHPDSPATGTHWMKQSLSFLKMKLTNNTLDQHGHIILHSMHRYCPRFHVIQADSPYTVRWGSFQTFSFPETVFTAVTAYQNPKVHV